MHTDLFVGVVGAGAMGSGIAQVAASAGHRVLLADANAGAVAKARASISKSLARDVEKGRTDEATAAAIVGRIGDAGDVSHGYAAFAECGLVLEAILEDPVAKQELFQALEAVVAADCVLATNTSSLSITAIAARCSHPERVVGIHFFNPAAVMPLVEIVPGLATDRAVLERAVALVKAWKKTTVVASDTPGFIVNRIARPFYSESLRQLEEGIADVATIDWAMREIGGFRMGPFELMDFIGNDVNYAVTSSVYAAFYQDARYRPSMIQRRLVDAGWYGRKSGRGFYDHRPGAERQEPKRDEFAGRSIFDRTIAMLVNSAVDALHMGVASAPDLETAMTKGVNYPMGLLAWGDEIGAIEILRRLEALHQSYGEERYRPSPLLRQHAREQSPLLG
ncbi:MAG: 3-hydroxyacyl-CoA dehydrogenase NAD-binding domain-containing protein [Gemmatimonadota bacterium]|nr:3-hydroxyacyl-CoA dehydrogenase NAD-binding domain-containing protein [Gemmatimonadota bacterium]